MIVTARVGNPGPKDLLGKVVQVPEGNALEPHAVIELRLLAAGEVSEFVLGPAQYLVVKEVP